MKKGFCLAILFLLVSSGLVLTASSQEQVALTISVYEGDFNGTLLSGVSLTGQDAEGNSFQGVTDSNGAVTVEGMPGTWQFIFTKEGYDTLNLNYDVTETGEGAVYLQRATSQGQVALTVDVHEGDLNGTVLSDVQVTGQDAAGNSFEGSTDSNGAVVIEGQPGTWQFAFTKDGYEPLSLSYDVTDTEEAAVYLKRADSPQE
jgi:uncharacterized protein YjbI with pentapeptide repeats